MLWLTVDDSHYLMDVTSCECFISAPVWSVCMYVSCRIVWLLEESGLNSRLFKAHFKFDPKKFAGLLKYHSNF